MREVCGRLILDTLDELLDPKHTALVVIDMQRGSFAKGGASERAGHDVSEVQRVAERTGELMDAARAAGVMLAHIRVANLPGHSSSSPAWLRALSGNRGKLANPISPDEMMIEGSWETEFCDECTPLEGELVVTKRRSSAFIGTDLEQILRSNGIETVAIAGIVTQGCVEATIRDAAHRDFYNVLVEDCVGGYNTTLHDAAMTVMRARHDTCTSDEVTESWQRATADATPAPVGATA